MKKNNYKKQDASGNQLPEAIGKGIDAEHLKKVQDARNVDAMNSFKSREIDKLNFRDVCKELGLNVSLVHRELMLNFIKENQ
jgi:hypothetical protein